MTSVTDVNNPRKRGNMGRQSNIMIQSTPIGSRLSLGPGSSVRRSNVSYSTSYGGGGGVALPSGMVSRVSKETVQNVKGERGKEKKTMQELNGKLANHLQKNALLEGINKQLAEECDTLRKMKGTDCSKVRQEFQDELAEARKEVVDAQKEVNALTAENLKHKDHIDTLIEQNKDLKMNIDDLNDEIRKLSMMLSEAESETNSLRRTCENIEREKDMLKKELAKLRDDNLRYRNDLEAARAAQLDAQCALDAAIEENEFNMEISREEIDQLNAFIKNMKSCQPGIQDMWKSQFQNVVEELREGCEAHYDQMIAENARRYEERILEMEKAQKPAPNSSHITNVNKRLKQDNKDLSDRVNLLEPEIDRLNKKISDLMEQNRRDCEECEEEKRDLCDKIDALRRELTEITDDLETIRNSKMDLELEISCYRKLLESEENKMKGALEQRSGMRSSGGDMLSSVISGGLQSSGGGGGQSSQSSNPDSGKTKPPGTSGKPEKTKKPEPAVSMSSSVGRVQVTRLSQSNIQIKECDAGGRWITLFNTSKVKDCEITGWKISRDGRRKIEYTFGKCVVEAGAQLRVFAKGAKDELDYQKQEDPKLNWLLADSCSSWGSGDGMVKLIGDDKKEKASCKIEYLV